MYNTEWQLAVAGCDPVGIDALVMRWAEAGQQV
jgi:hypothetical protein